MARLLEASQHNSPNGPETPGRRFDIQSDLPELLAAFYFECFTTLTFLLCLLLCLALLLMNIHTNRRGEMALFPTCLGRSQRNFK